MNKEKDNPREEEQLLPGSETEPASEAAVTEAVTADDISPMRAGITPFAASSDKGSFSPGADLPTPKDAVESLTTLFLLAENVNEIIQMGSGALNYAVTDLSLPGKNGFDLVIRRTYNSADANTAIPSASTGHPYGTTSTNKEELYYWTLVYTYEDGWKSSWDSYGYYSSQQAARDAGTVEKNKLLAEEPSLVPLRLNVVVTKFKTYWNRTVQRPHQDLVDIFGLGHGWSFNLPWIEIIPPEQRDRKLTYHPYFHDGDGRSYLISGPILTGAIQFADAPKEYFLKDIAIKWADQKYTVTFKDGRTVYFNEQHVLSHITDRFGNRRQMKGVVS